MSGHSKWHNIRLKKGKMDAERGKTFTRLARDIIVAAKTGRRQPRRQYPPSLRYPESAGIVDARRQYQARHPARLRRSRRRRQYDEITYEGYGPGGVAVLVQCYTDNRQRTVADVRSYFTKTGGNLGESGSVALPLRVEGHNHHRPRRDQRGRADGSGDRSGRGRRAADSGCRKPTAK